MHTLLPSECKRGMVLMLDGVPHLIEEFHTGGSAQFKQKLHVRLRNLKTGRVADRMFADNERVASAELQHRKVQFSYQQGDTFVFFDIETSEELDLTAELVGDRNMFFKENEEYKALFLEGKLLDIQLPQHMRLQVTDTAPAQRGGSDSAWKSATLETGLELMVPLFIDKGDHIRVDTQTRKYAGKESS